jgi:lipopolysaccharide transport system ATP-binding protein
MSVDPVIRVQNVSKVYPELGSSLSLRQEGLKLIKKTLLSLGPPQPPSAPVGFQALKDITFDVYPGEGVALVGKNGSGKTTLIRLMANIMRPTTGTIELHGRYTALIGLGTGFIPDMTGYDNVYLNAAIYGVPPHETDAIIEQIIDFASIGDFIYRRVREYSNGMRARLGFSVAVHILPDIIMVDEILAVGDASFQKKCRNKIDELLADNRTLVFVSHSTNEVKRLCSRAIWLNEGEVQLQDSVDIVLKEYNAFMEGRS